MKGLFIFLLGLSTAISLYATDKPSHVILETNKGKIELKLFWDVAPKACENFVSLVRKGYYDKTIFHRVIKGFMIQGGDPTGTGMGGESIWGKPFKDEFKPNVIFDKPGLLAMANRGPNTNGSQFFITVAPAPWLNGGYTIFGKVVKGFDVVKKINEVKTGQYDRPIEKVLIKKAYIVEDKKSEKSDQSKKEEK